MGRLADELNQSSGTEQTENTVETPQEAPEQAEGGRARDEHGRFTTAASDAPTAPVESQPPTEPSPDTDSDPKSWTYAAYRDEKQKRQDAETRIRDAEDRARDAQRRMSQLQAEWQQRQQQPQEAIDPISEPERFQQSIQQRFQSELAQRDALVGYQLARRDHGAELLDKAYAELTSAAERGDPSIGEVSNAPVMERAEAMVNWYRKRETMSQVGPDLDAYRQRLREEILAEMNGGTQPTQQSQAQMPSNLAGARNVGSRSGPAWNGPAPIGDIFSRSRAKG